MNARLRHIVGHARIVNLLSGAIARETLPPTLLFTGPTGIGKWQTAGAIAAALNCLAPVRSPDTEPSFDACGSCRSCDRTARGVHVDVVSLEPDDLASIKIGVVREMLERTAYRPFEGRRRAVLIREAETLEPSAQNALLKALEEPPPGTTFVLTSAAPGVLLTTVRSRCMRLAFGALSPPEIAAILVSRHGVPDEEARTAAAVAGGSASHALALRSTDLALVRDTALIMLQQVAANNAAAARLQTAATLVNTPAKKERTREEMALILRQLASMLRDLEVLNARADPSTLANVGLREELERVRARFQGARARDAFLAVDQALVALERNAGTKLVAEWVSLQL